MSDNQDDFKKMFDRVEQTLNQADQMRQQHLETLHLMQAVKTHVLKKEQTRLIDKLGQDHPQVQAIQQRLQDQRQIYQGLTLEVEKAKIQVSVPDKDTWMVHGRVMDEKQQGLSGLVVTLGNDQGKPNTLFKPVETNAQGYFALQYSPGQEKDQTAAEARLKEKWYLLVLDKKQQLLAQDQNPLVPVLGQIDYREIFLAKGQGNTGETVDPSPDGQPSGEKSVPDSSRKAGKTKPTGDKASGV